MSESRPPIFDRRMTIYTAAASGLFCMGIAAGTARHALRYYALAETVAVEETYEDLERGESRDPLAGLREEVRESPDDGELRRRFRLADLERRRQAFVSLARVKAGAFLLLFGGVTFILSLRWLGRLAERPPRPAPRTDRDAASRERRLSIAATYVLALLATALAAGLAAWTASAGGAKVPSAKQEAQAQARVAK